MEKKYDIFISYRRTAFETANLLATRLKALGYSVFFDLEEMNQGKFNEQLLFRIEQCKDFIIVLPPDALDRCHNQDDWVRKELLCAMANNKNIIPVLLEGFDWPENMPAGLENLRLYQAVMPLPITYYDMQIKRIRTYLKAKPHKRTMRIISICLASLLLVLLGLFIAEECIYRPAANQLSNEFTVKMVCIDGTVNAVKESTEVLNKHIEDIQNAKDSVALKQAVFDMRNVLVNDTNYTARNIFSAKLKELNFAPIQLYTFAFRDIAMDEISACKQFEDDFYYYIKRGYKHYFLALDVINDPIQFKSHLLNASFDHKVAEHIAETMTYGYLYDISRLPSKAQEVYYSTKSWKRLPMNIGLKYTKKEYLNLQEQSMSEMETTIITYEVKMQELKNN